MIKNKQTLKTLKGLIKENNGIELSKDISRLLRSGKTPYIFYNEILVFSDSPPAKPEKIGCQRIYVGTGIQKERKGVICANSAETKINYFSDNGELIEESGKVVKCQKSLLELPMTLLNRTASNLLRRHPTVTKLIGEEIYLIERGSIKTENHRMKSPYKENLLNDRTLPQLKYICAEEYRSLFESIASERRAAESL